MKNIFGQVGKPFKSRVKIKPEFSPSLNAIGKTSSEKSVPHFTFYYFILFVLVLIFGARLVNLQVVEGAKNLYLAEGNRIRLSKISAPRGIIFDRNDTALVQNILRYDIEIIPNQMPNSIEERVAILAKLSDFLEQDLAGIKDKIFGKNMYSSDAVVVKEDISQADALVYQIKFEEMEGVLVAIKPLRKYDDDFGLAHIVGYIGKITEDELTDRAKYAITDWIGKIGLELFYEDKLRGQYGQTQIEVNAKGRLQRVIATLPAVKGEDIKLSLDLNLQKKAFENLKIAVEKGNGKGVAIATNPQNGEILSLVSLPSYNNNAFVKPDMKEEVHRLFTDEARPLVNRAISGLYPIGSTIKPLVATIALSNKVVSESYKVDTPLEIVIGDFHFPDWKDHGLTDIRRALAESNNIFFYALGGGWDKIKGLGIDRLASGLKKFRLNQITGIDLIGEKKGIVPDPEWKKKTKSEPWYLGDTYHMSIGQGDIVATPIELLSAIASIASGGRYYAPHLILDSRAKPLEEKIAGENDLRVVREGMKMAWDEGSARSIQGIKDKNGNDVSGGAKTGTAQTGRKNQNGDDITHGWFVAFAPYENPEIAVLVLVEEGGDGYTTALPVAKEILKEYFREE
ncbi:penicillin-binding protein 2 [Candidatus Berkelbacteria bacterium CG_4_9_14_3_um_filter_39_23]|uniref:Penicillin-binding protein 2 n=2 Tax=Candidatus Berkelbacteria TaxID=1618330 RepID=A0A2M7CIS9_9BACT|nr:penicillin-binding protein 2 [Candidatus Berkelbacteria bacterium]OIP04907.1 MAG: penicillin-binding protein 2 [Candidatus Berkelbacteria bacterium CG2_30_39_44]PIR27597.1 MAG: penicillin-binding protein 2 [Candidatus Berkelbacteria bacterium CG11_big_fil_rev_8_21_14_0_20_40_23]PIV25556.1 MAG: penicillin-binding protein 2 [Candidatus Berkelbacteria bacterium CG03_land_8_20_14_0_80_40_36]PIX30769.1 MAG: penicillin-binding protein 2 [Candidatus Berkelbacteria bacterium CG_4_8_14_3_um_filter_39